jgi:hypothetical protein
MRMIGAHGVVSTVEGVVEIVAVAVGKGGERVIFEERRTLAGVVVVVEGEVIPILSKHNGNDLFCLDKFNILDLFFNIIHVICGSSL